MKTCPECAKFYTGFKCKCGFKEPFRAKQGFAGGEEGESHPDANKCFWYDQGIRCHRIGTMSTHPLAGSVRPVENRPIYCPWHFEQIINPYFSQDPQAQDLYFQRMKQYPRAVKLSEVQ